MDNRQASSYNCQSFDIRQTLDNRITMAGVNIVLLVFSLLSLFFQMLLIVFSTIYGMGFINDNFYGITLTIEVLLILLPVLIYSLYHRVDFKKTFRLRSPGVLPVILITLASLPAYFVALFLNNAAAYVLQFIGELPKQPVPVPRDLTELLVGILVIAVSPAICEEMLHRGLMLSAYERRGTYRAVVFTAVFFGLFHFDLTNLAGPIFLGILIGYYVIRTNSIFAGMLAHFLNNAIAETLQYLARNILPVQETSRIGLDELLYLGIYSAIGFIFLCLFVYLFEKVTARKEVRYIPPLSTLRNDLASIFSHPPIIIVISLYVLFSGVLIMAMTL